MRTHIRFLAALQIVFGAIGILAGIGALLLFGSLAAFAGWVDHGEGGMFATPILGTIGVITFLIAITLSVPQLAAGLGLWYEREWGRILSLVMCALNLINVPLGAVLGVYGLWVLLSNEGAAYFDRRNPNGGAALPAPRI